MGCVSFMIDKARRAYIRAVENLCLLTCTPSPTKFPLSTCALKMAMQSTGKGACKWLENTCHDNSSTFRWFENS